MNEKRVIEVDPYEHRVIIDSLNDKRNSLIEKGAKTDELDGIIMEVIDAPMKKPRKKDREMER